VFEFEGHVLRVSCLQILIQKLCADKDLSLLERVVADFSNDLGVFIFMAKLHPHYVTPNNAWLYSNTAARSSNLDAGLLALSQYSEGPATGHLDTGFCWFPCVYKQMLRWFPRFQVATTYFSCSPPDLNLLVTSFIFCIHYHRVTTQLQLIIIIIIIIIKIFETLLLRLNFSKQPVAPSLTTKGMKTFWKRCK